MSPLRLAMALLTSTLLAASPLHANPWDDDQIDQRIDQIRKRDLSLTLTGDDGAPVQGPVNYRLLRHSFEFGTALSGTMLGLAPERNPQPAAETIALYRQIAARHFTAAVCENEMKWYAMENAEGERPERIRTAEAMYDWCVENGLAIRGHCVFWGVARWLPNWQKELAAQSPEQIEARMKLRLRRVMDRFAERIPEWDLNNEMMHEDIFAKGMNLESQATYFHWARAVAPNVRFYVNEYGVLQGNEIDRYVNHIKSLLADGAVIGGIGDQAHFFRAVPDNRRLWEIIEKMAQFNLPVKITEFDLDYPQMTEADQAEQLRRFYRLCFSHPAIEGIYMWGFIESAHWRGRRAAIWRADGTPKPAAEAYIKLLTEEWTTTGQATPDAAGHITFRGFPGLYEITTPQHKAHLKLTGGPASATLP